MMTMSRRIGRYAVVDLNVDLSFLSECQLKCLKYLVLAADIMNHIYWKQTYVHSEAIRDMIALCLKYAPAELADKLSSYYDLLTVNFCPFDVLNNNSKIIPNFSMLDLEECIKRAPDKIKDDYSNRLKEVGEQIFSTKIDPIRPDGANLYHPHQLSREEIEKIIAKYPADKRESVQAGLRKLNTEIRIKNNDLIEIIPYEDIHQEQLLQAARHLLSASDYASNPFKEYLRERALALISGYFYHSDCVWVDVESEIDIVIGPVETYLDKLFGYKSSYEAKVTVADRDGTRQLETFQRLHEKFQASLPCPEEFKISSVAAFPRTNVVQVLYYAGEANSGMKNIAWQLPNDDTIIKTKGCKVFIARNVLEAKAKGILIPILRKIIDNTYSSKYDDSVIVKAFSTRVLLHEFSHALGLRKKRS